MPRRSIDTSIWTDERFADLSPEAKLVYIRLVTGDDTGAAGATRVHIRRLTSDTGLSGRRVEACLELLVGCGLVRRYEGGWHWLPAWIRYQVAGPNFCRAVRRQAKECPEALARAIGRALDDHAPRQPPTKSRTRKDANTSANDKAYERVGQGSANPSGGGSGLEPMPPTGANGFGGDSCAVAGEGASSAVPRLNGADGAAEVDERDLPPVALTPDQLAQLAAEYDVMAEVIELRRRPGA
jgi:hypothetical protein